MKTLLLLLLTFQLIGCATDPKTTPEQAGSETQDFVEDKILVILGSHVDFHSARLQAEAISRSSKIPFSMQGMVYDDKRGLILPDDSSDEVFAGSYLLRRYDTNSLSPSAEPSEFISIERSDAYPGLAPGVYIILGGIHDEPKQARKALAQFASSAPEAHLKKTRIYMGCLH